MKWLDMCAGAAAISSTASAPSAIFHHHLRKAEGSFLEAAASTACAGSESLTLVWVPSADCVALSVAVPGEGAAETCTGGGGHMI